MAKLSYDCSLLLLWNSGIGNASPFFTCIFGWCLISNQFDFTVAFFCVRWTEPSAWGLGLHNLINKIPMTHPKVNEILQENANERTNRACNYQIALEFAQIQYWISFTFLKQNEYVDSLEKNALFPFALEQQSNLMVLVIGLCWIKLFRKHSAFW